MSAFDEINGKQYPPTIRGLYEWAVNNDAQDVLLNIVVKSECGNDYQETMGISSPIEFSGLCAHISYSAGKDGKYKEIACVTLDPFVNPRDAYEIYDD